jgi:3-phytase
MSNPNNVDLRNDVMIGDRLRIIVAATLKKTSEIAVFELDPKSGELLDILETPIHTVPENETYGFCLYRNPDTKSLYAITTDKSGLIEQWLLFETENGKISGTKMRQLRVETQPEGCVADDINGKLFVGEEAVGVWKFDADPNGSKDKTLIAKVSDGAIAADVEGLALYVPPEQSAEAGYLIVSSQGSNSYALYSRSKPHTYRGSLQITYKGLMTGDTDGLDVTALSLGPNYPRGMLVVQDGLYKRPGQKERNQNFKFVSWKDIEDGLSLSPN